jgi:hypothetical protein
MVTLQPKAREKRLGAERSHPARERLRHCLKARLDELNAARIWLPRALQRHISQRTQGLSDCHRLWGPAWVARWQRLDEAVASGRVGQLVNEIENRPEHVVGDGDPTQDTGRIFDVFLTIRLQESCDGVARGRPASDQTPATQCPCAVVIQLAAHCHVLVHACLEFVQIGHAAPVTTAVCRANILRQAQHVG